MQERNANTATLPVGAARSRRLPLDLLHTFEATARHLSFTRAAQELFLTQSAVSRQIQQLEASLGAALYERRHRSLALTPAGRIMQRAVNDSLERLHDAVEQVRAADAPRQVALTCTPGFASFWLIPRLARFTEHHPTVDVRISATLELLDLERSRVDLAIRFAPAAQVSGPVLFEEEVQPLCAPRLLRDRERPLKTPADLQRHTLLTIDMPAGEPPTADWEPWLRLMGLRELRTANTMRFTLYSEAVAAACEGQGVVIGRLPLLAPLVHAGALVAPFRGAAASRRAYFIAMSARGSRNPDAQDFVQWIVREAEQARAALPARPGEGAPGVKRARGAR